MIPETKKVFYFLCSEVFKGLPKFRTLFKSFKECSRDSTNNRYVVESETRAINFDKLTKRLYNRKNYPRSADAVTFSDNTVFLIEFKAGDQVVGIYSTRHLTSEVTEKINGSDQTMYEKVFSKINSLNMNVLKLRFCLVVDAEAMGIYALVRTQAELASGESTEQNGKLAILLKQVLPDLKAGIHNPEHYDEIEIWYSDVFERYLEKYGIKDINAYETM